jgi:hypothetical protein
VTDFRVGELVDITIRGARVANAFTRTGPDQVQTEVLVFHTCEHMGCNSSTVNMTDPGVTVEQVTPAEWPPRFGDVWRDGSGELWVVRRCYSGMDADGPTYREELFALSDTADETGCHTGSWLQGERGPLTLVSRIAEQPDGEA